MEKVSTFTIIAANYTPYAIALAESYLKFYPHHKFYVLSIDDKKHDIPRVSSVNISEIRKWIPNLREMQFKYNILEYSTAVKPFFIKWLLETQHASKILYFDPDIYLFDNIDKIFNLLEGNECVLIPHITEPYRDSKHPSEIDIMKAGYYNLGFVAFRITKNTRRFVSWWCNKLAKYAYSDPDNYMFTDQKWMDFAPLYLKTCVFKEKGYNVAYWNLHEYINKFDPKNVKFFHYSGFSPQKKLISKYQNRFNYSNIAEYARLFKFYEEKINDITKKFNLSKSIKNYKYPFNYFDNGIEVTPTIRRIFRYIIEAEDKKFSNPFATKDRNSFYQFLLKTRKIGNFRINNFSIYFYKANKHIQKTFPNIEFTTLHAEKINQYIDWLTTSGKVEYNIPSVFLKNITRSNLFSKFIFYNKTSLLQKFLILEKMKRKYQNELFLEKLYLLLLNRDIDVKGKSRNLRDLATLKAGRNKVILRILLSKEFKSKNKIDLSYFLYLSSLIPRFFLEEVFLFLKRLFEKDKVPIESSRKNLFGINLAGYLDTDSGVAESSRGLVRALQTTTLNFNLNNIPQIWLKRSDTTFKNLITKRHNYPINIICVNADQLEHVVLKELGEKYIQGKYNIGYWYWESNKWNDRFNTAFYKLNEVWVATNFVYNALSRISPLPIVKIPPAIQLPTRLGQFNFAKYRLPINKSDFLFLNIFDSASFWERKNPVGLIKAFKRVFNNNARVKLIIKTTPFIREKSIYSTLKEEMESTNNIFLMEDYLTRREILRLMNSCDVYISLHRAEGLGLPLLESMYLGRPVIATAYGGNTDFMDINNSFLVRYKPYILDKDVGPYPKGSVWAEPDLEHAEWIMKKIVNNYTEAIQLSRRGQYTVKSLYNPKRIGEQIEERIKIIIQNFI